MNSLQDLIDLAQVDAYPQEAIEAAKVVLVHDIAVALSARSLVGELLEDPYAEGRFTDMATGRGIDMPSAVSRNGQLIHALTQDDTHLPAMTHVGATTLPLLFALGEQSGNMLPDLLAGLAAAFATAEFLGQPTAPALSGRGIRPTPVIGPIAALVGAGRMQNWDDERLSRAVGRAAASSLGTTQAWVDGSHEWLFEIGVAGLIALSAARSAVKPWQISQNPLWGKAGLFRCLGLTREQDSDRGLDHLAGATRANVKRLPACAISQVPIALLQEAMGTSLLPSNATLRLQLSPPEATYPGITRDTELNSWSARLMSLPYGMAVMGATGDFTVDDLVTWPTSLSPELLRRVEVVPNAALKVGQYEVEVISPGQATRQYTGSLDDVGRPSRKELGYAALKSLGENKLESLVALVDSPEASVNDLLSSLIRQ